MAITVDHIADVSFANHFLQGEVPVDGKITVMGSTTNGNTFNVRFADGKVNVRFASGNFFTNMFRGKTLSRLTQRLQTQYDTWIAQQEEIAQQKAVVQIAPQKAVEEIAPQKVVEEIAEQKTVEEVASKGFKDYPNVAKIEDAVNECRAIIEATNPPGAAVFILRLKEVRKLANLRNQLTNEESGAECFKTATQAGFSNHADDYCVGKGDAEVKRYVLSTIDTVLDGFLQVIAQMKDKNAQVPEFLHNFDGACLEAKNDNIQAWLSRAAGIAHAARSDESHNLAYSVTAEFNAIADEVRKPFEDAARAECEAGVRAECAEKGITDEATIKGRIENKVQMLVLDKEDEIEPLIRKKLEGDGKFAVYEALAGARRPVTEIAKDETTGRWTVTTLTDKSGKPIMKSVSGMDIDRNYAKLVDMFMNGAIAMGTVDYKTRVEEGVTFATKEDLLAEGVLDTLDRYEHGNLSKADLKELVRAELGDAFTFTPEKFDELFDKGFSFIAQTQEDDTAETKQHFRRLVNNFASAAYLEKKNDRERLAYLIARQMVVYSDQMKASLLTDLDAKASRCAQMLRVAYPDYKVNVAKAKDAIATTIERLVKAAYPDKINPEDQQKVNTARRYLKHIHFNGTLFTERLEYDIGHRAAGKNEINLHNQLRALRSLVKQFANVTSNEYMTKIGA